MGPSRLSFGTRAGHPCDYNPTTQQASITTNHSRTNPAQPLHQWSVDALTTALQQGLEQAHADESEIPECSAFAFVLDGTALVKLIRPSTGPYAAGGPQDLPDEFKLVSDSNAGDAGDDYEDGEEKRYSEVSVETVLGVEDDKMRSIVQRAASRGLITAVEKIDGFRYTFNNAWAAKDEEGQRFSYICQDSMQNKDRHANGFLRAAQNAKAMSPDNEGNRGARKPTYDCKGAVSVKFSRTRGLAEVFYRHFAIHKTVAERKPGRPRKSDYIRVKDRTVEGIRTHAALRKYKEGLARGDPSTDDESDTRDVSEGAVPYSAPRSTAVNVSRKRKRETSGSVGTSNTAPQPMSLAAMLSAEVVQETPALTRAPMVRDMRPSAIQYDLPSWQKSPTPPPQPAQPTQSNKVPTIPFAPPHNPNVNKMPIPPTYSNRHTPRQAPAYYGPFSQPQPQPHYPPPPNHNCYQPSPPTPAPYAPAPTAPAPTTRAWNLHRQPSPFTQTMNGVAGPVQGRYRLEPLRRGPKHANSSGGATRGAAPAVQAKTPPLRATKPAVLVQQGAPASYRSPHPASGPPIPAAGGAAREREKDGERDGGLAEWEEALRAGERAEAKGGESPDPWFPKR